MPLFSIITVTHNAANTLEDSILSVIKQDSRLYEYIVIDGGSSDQTLDIVKKYQDSISYWCSEKDNGIYDAMNKGIDVSSGEWILFLGSDDRLKDGVLAKIASILSEDADLVYGNVVFNNGKAYISTFNLKTFLHNTVHHQSAFYNKRLFADFKYDDSLKIMSDYELNLRLFLNKRKRTKVDIDISECNTNGASSAIALSLQETNLIRSRYFNRRTASLLNALLKIKYFIQYDLLRKI